MTALDQAFIRAYRRQGNVPVAAPTQTALTETDDLDSRSRPASPSPRREQPPAPHVGLPGFGSQVAIVGMFEPHAEPAPAPPQRPTSAGEEAPQPAASSSAWRRDAQPAPAPRPPHRVPPVVRALRRPVAPVGPPPAVEETTVAPAPSAVPSKPPPNVAPEVPPTRAYAAEAPPAPETFPGLPPETLPPETPPAPATPIEETNKLGPAYHRVDAPQTPEPPAWAANEPAAKTAPERPFRPLLQVDRFAWPQVCARLAQSAPAELDRLADQLLAAGERGTRVVGLAAASAGSGVSTAVLCAARQLARRGVRVALVDGNLADPQLARRLGLLPEFGLEELLAGRQPLEEIVIESAAEPVVVVPLCQPGDEELSGDAAARLRRALATLAGAYELVLLDLGSLDAASAAGCSLVRALAGSLGGVALVQHAEGTTKERVNDARRALAQQGVEVWGLIENFTRR